MFCPQCRAEYRPGFAKCADCDVDLVAELSPEQEQIPIEWVEVLATYNPGDIAVLKSLLDGENITYYFKGEYFSSLAPLSQPARLIVDQQEVEIVKTLIKDLDLDFDGVVPGKGKDKKDDE